MQSETFHDMQNLKLPSHECALLLLCFAEGNDAVVTHSTAAVPVLKHVCNYSTP